MVGQLLFDALFPATARHSVQTVNAAASAPASSKSVPHSRPNSQRRPELVPVKDIRHSVTHYKIVYADDKSEVDVGPLDPQFVRSDAYPNALVYSTAYKATHRPVSKTQVRRIDGTQHIFVPMPVRQLLMGYMTNRNQAMIQHGGMQTVDGDVALSYLARLFDATEYDDFTPRNELKRDSQETCMQLGSNVVSAQIARLRCQQQIDRNMVLTMASLTVAVASGVALFVHSGYFWAKQAALWSSFYAARHFSQKRIDFETYDRRLRADLIKIDMHMSRTAAEYRKNCSKPIEWYSDLQGSHSAELVNDTLLALSKLPHGYADPKAAMVGLDEWFLENRNLMFNHKDYFDRMEIITGLGVHPYIRNEPNPHCYSSNRYDKFLKEFTNASGLDDR